MAPFITGKPDMPRLELAPGKVKKSFAPQHECRGRRCRRIHQGYTLKMLKVKRQINDSYMPYIYICMYALIGDVS